jgi:hypothetical protein
MTERGHGALLGAAAAVATAFAFCVSAAASDAHAASWSQRPWWVDALLWLTIAVPVGTYMAAFVLALRRTTRGLGLGMLLAVTLMLPVTVYWAWSWSYMQYSSG